MLLVKKLIDKAIIPKKGSVGAAGYDLYSVEECIIPSKGKKLIKTGLSIACPNGTYARIAPRSGLALKNFIDVGAGVIDEDYRGEVCVLLFNFDEIDFSIKYGDRIAQMIVEYVVPTQIVENDNLALTDRGQSGFGSTGVKLNDKMQAQDQNNSQKKNCDYSWQELTIIELWKLQQEGLITAEQKQQLGTLTINGSKQVYNLINKQNCNREQLSQSLLEFENYKQQ